MNKMKEGKDRKTKKLKCVGVARVYKGMIFGMDDRI